MPSVTPSLKAIKAIAHGLLEPFNETDRDDDAAAEAYSAIVYSDEMRYGLEKDRRFCVPDVPEIDVTIRSASTDINDPLNVLSPRNYFELGFDLALAMTTRIVSDPLADHDISDLVDSTRAQLLDEIRNHRDSYVEEWGERVRNATRDFPPCSGFGQELA